MRQLQKDLLREHARTGFEAVYAVKPCSQTVLASRMTLEWRATVVYSPISATYCDFEGLELALPVAAVARHSDIVHMAENKL